MPAKALTPRPVTPSHCSECREAHMTHNQLPREAGLMERISDLIGSVRGIWLLALIEAIYVVAASTGFDPYPFPFLTLVLSLVALQFSQVILVVQNRQGALLEAKQAVERETVARDYEMDTTAVHKLDAIMAHLGCPAPGSPSQPSLPPT